MKKFTLILIVLLLVSLVADAQHGRKKSRGRKAESTGYYAISLGPSLPMGTYAATDLLDDKSGLAKTGLHINLANVGFKLSDNFGIAGLINLGANKWDAGELGLKEDDAYWVYGALMAGPYLTFEASDEISVDFRPVAGMSYIAAPEINDDDGSVLTKSEQKSAFAFDIGASLRYRVATQTDIGLHLDYFSAKPSFSESYEGWKGSVSVLGITLGVAFRF